MDKQWIVLAYIVLFGAACLHVPPVEETAAEPRPEPVPVTHSYPQDSLESPGEGVRTMRASSAAEEWRNDNADARIIGPGGTLTLADLEGPGRITHLWFTIAASERYYPQRCVVRIYWDGRETPAVEAPLGDFFAVGHGLSENVDSAQVAVTSHGRSYNSYWPMPFRESARVTFTNESTEMAVGLYWYVDWEQRPVPEDIPYFHAQYRQERPVTPGRDYLILDTEGRGHYVGTVMSVRMSQPGWFGEGDDRFFIDGEAEPRLRGTGTEDYFCDAWAFRQFNRPYYGVTVWEGQHPGDRGSFYRWHVPDPVYFDESLRFTIEHKGNTFDEDYRLLDPYTDRRPDWYSSVAFWYQTGAPTAFTTWPSMSDRIPAYETFEVETLLEGNLPARSYVEDWQYFSGQKAIVFDPEKPGAVLEIGFPVFEPGDYLVFLRAMPRWDAGVYRFRLNGRLVSGDWDGYATNAAPVDLKLGHLHTFEQGIQVIEAVCVGAHAESGALRLVADALYLERVPRPGSAEDGEAPQGEEAEDG